MFERFHLAPGLCRGKLAPFRSREKTPGKNGAAPRVRGDSQVQSDDGIMGVI